MSQNTIANCGKSVSMKLYLVKSQISLLLSIIMLKQWNTLAMLPKTARIVGGSLTNISAHPYLMQLHFHGRFFCGGSLISDRHVLTAAHCVKGLKAADVIVKGGTSYSNSMSDKENGVSRQVARIIIPKTYSESSMHMDVAVLKLTEDMTGPNIEKIPLCTAKLKAGESLLIAGWGRVKEKSAEAATQLRSAKVPLMPRSQCQRLYKGYGSLTRSMFCASKLGVSDACSGDSGGPGVYKDQLCGIVSWGVGCARKNFPGVYTNVNQVKTFIQESMKL